LYQAYSVAHKASQALISWESQFVYGRYVTWFYTAIVALFCFLYAFHAYLDRKPHDGSAGLVNKIKAAVRVVSYRRISGPLGVYFGLPSFGVILILFVSLVASTAMSFAQHPYYRPKRGYGSPPLGVRTGLMAAALIPLTIALAGKVNLVTWLTGIGHEKLNVFHRYVGWILFYLSVVHTLPFFICLAEEGGMAYVKKKFYAPGALEVRSPVPSINALRNRLLTCTVV
jgi:hypothetical protein